MDKIEVKVIQQPSDPGVMSAFLARMTQRGHEVSCMDDLLNLKEKPSTLGFIGSLANMDHGTIKRFDSYTVAIVGASRRFLAQIRTHQHADFVSGSLQYSNWSNTHATDMFVTPYEIMEDEQLRHEYISTCIQSYLAYQHIAELDNDAAGFVMPNGLRNILVMQANVQAWQYIIGLRTCKRNSTETRYVLLRIWEALQNTPRGKVIFCNENSGPACMRIGCQENHMSCKHPYTCLTSPTEIIANEFPLLMKG